MQYTLHQHGRAAIEFLSDLRLQSDRLEAVADAKAAKLRPADDLLPDDIVELHRTLTPLFEDLSDFRMLRLCRDWTLEEHGSIAMAAFEEIRAEVATELDRLQTTPRQPHYADNPPAPDYWKGFEFHKSAGGWDGHDYMGFVHGELIHRKMVNPNFAGLIYATRKSVAETAPAKNPARILEIGCCSGQYTQGLAEVFPHAKISACDLSARQLEQAQRYANEHGFDWDLFQCAGEATGQPDSSFDLVTSYAMFHELPVHAAKSVLRECLRVNRPGGYTVIGDVKAYHAFGRFERWKSDYWNQQHGGDPYWREYASSDLAKLALEAGFAEARWEGLGPNQYPFVLIARKSATA